MKISLGLCVYVYVCLLLECRRCRRRARGECKRREGECSGYREGSE